MILRRHRSAPRRARLASCALLACWAVATGCGERAPSGDAPAAPADGARAVEPASPLPSVAPQSSAAEEAGAVRYSCENGLAVLVHPPADDAGDAPLRLSIDGARFELAAVVSASGAKFESKAGLSPGKTLVWWTKGDEAMLIEAPLASDAGDAETILACVEVTPVDAAEVETASSSQALRLRSDDPSVAITGVLRDGLAVSTTGLGSAAAIAALPTDEDGIECASDGLEVRMSNRVVYRPAVNLCDADWALVVPTARPAAARAAPAPDGFAWTTGKSSDANEAWLAYGVPETDATAMTASCQPGTARVSARFVAQTAGAAVIEFVAPDRLLRYGATRVATEGSEAGPDLALELWTHDVLWNLLRSGAVVPYQAAAGEPQLLDASAGTEPIGSFLDACEGE